MSTARKRAQAAPPEGLDPCGYAAALRSRYPRPVPVVGRPGEVFPEPSAEERGRWKAYDAALRAAEALEELAVVLEADAPPLDAGERDRLIALCAEILRLDGEATPGPWRWWTSCSFRRLSSDATGKDGDVLSGGIQRHDGQPDVVCSEADRALIAHYRTAAPDLARSLRALLTGTTGTGGADKGEG